MLSERAMQLADIQTGIVSTGMEDRVRTAAGRLVASSSSGSSIVTQISGRIERLWARETGKQIRKGDPVAELYSPELSAMIGEHLLMINNAKGSAMAEGSRNKLMKAGLTAVQVAAAEQSGKVPAVLLVHAAVSGELLSANVREGMWVGKGDVLITLRSVNVLQAEADLFPAEWDNVKPGMRMQVKGSGGATFDGTIIAYSPDEIAAPANRPVRLTVSGLPPASKEGDPVWIMVPQPTERTGMSVPDEAVVHSGGKAGVFIQTGKGAFRLQPVVTGSSTGGKTRIISGLSAGDTIAFSGAWLMHGELQNRLGKSPLQ